ncbi:MAG: hypothetical protein ACYCYR_10500 [Desulfobulbaceae bacterium]
MSLKERFEKYPNLKNIFWPGAIGIKYTSDNPHPLTSLVLGDGSRTKDVAMRTDKCTQLVKDANEQWLKEKVKIILEDEDRSNVSASLGEIRAYGELIWIWEPGIEAGKSGSDFSLKANEKTVKIEVNTPQHRTKRHTLNHESFDTDRIKGKVYEIFPFGWPERNIDNVQGEAASKLAAIKQKEHQFDKDSINILWIDLKDPTLWVLDFGFEQFLPLSAFREEITSGAFWNAFYAKKGTYIFDQLSMHGLASRIYKIEYNGRFWGNSLIDFVIADTRTDQIVFQNHSRDSCIPNELYQSLHRLFGFNLELSWLDWPIKGQLATRIKLELDRIQVYKEAFDRD